MSAYSLDQGVLKTSYDLVLRVEKVCNKNSNVPQHILPGNVMMAVDTTNLNNILSSGFKNMYETGKGAFYLGKKQQGYLKNRQAAENDLVCSDLGTNNPSLRPKYGFFIPENNQIGSLKARIDPKYGNVIIVFKDDVKKRSTITIGDSLNVYSQNINPADSFKPRSYLPKPFGYIKSYTFFGTTLGALGIDSDYYEVQIYGPLAFDDVAEIRVRKDIYQTNLGIFQKVNLPIYEIKEGSYIFEKGMKLK